MEESNATNRQPVGPFLSAATPLEETRFVSTYLVRWAASADPTRAVGSPKTAEATVTLCAEVGLVRTRVLREYLEQSISWKHSWLVARQFLRAVLGPSSLGGSAENATMQGVEDATVSWDFLARHAPSIAEIERLSELPQGWDSYGARAIDPRAREGAIRFLALLHTIARNAGLPIVGPSVNGGVLLQWFSPAAEVFVEVGPSRLRYDVGRPGADSFLLEHAGPLTEMHQAAVNISPHVQPH